MWFSLLGRVALFLASAVGTTLATLGFSQYVAVTVAFSTAVSRWLSATRVEERRAANLKAASALNGAKLHWEALPQEKRSQQTYIDKLVLDVESCLEQTLPPASKDAPTRAKESDVVNAAATKNVAKEEEEEDPDAVLPLPPQAPSPPPPRAPAATTV